MQDEYGQPLNAAFNQHRNLMKSLECLIGICRGLTADNQLNEAEIRFLDTWLADNEALAQAWPGDVLATRIRTVLADGRVTAEEADHLKDTLEQLIGGNMYEHGAATGMATRLPVDPVDEIDFEGSTFCITGTFVYGTRRKCVEVIEACGGIVQSGVTKGLDYLVIGTLSSRDWKQSSHGTKISKAVENRESGCPVKIIAEEDWARCLQEAGA